MKRSLAEERDDVRDDDAYWAVLHDRAIPDYRSNPGSRGAIRAFAGDDIEVAKYYPEDRDFLLEFEPRVQHYEVTSSDV